MDHELAVMDEELVSLHMATRSLALTVQDPEIAARLANMAEDLLSLTDDDALPDSFATACEAAKSEYC